MVHPCPHPPTTRDAAAIRSGGTYNPHIQSSLAPRSLSLSLLSLAHTRTVPFLLALSLSPRLSPHLSEWRSRRALTRSRRALTRSRRALTRSRRALTRSRCTCSDDHTQNLRPGDRTPCNHHSPAASSWRWCAHAVRPATPAASPPPERRGPRQPDWPVL